MRALLDVSMLLALFDSDHVFHTRSRTWWADHWQAGWASCPLTQNGFLRIISQPSYQRTMRLPDAIKLLMDRIQAPGHKFWPDDLSLLDKAFIDHARLLGPRHLTDAYLLALAVKHGGRFVTFDPTVPFAAARGAQQNNLVSLI